MINYAKPIVAERRANMVRVDADFSATPFKAKISNAELEWLFPASSRRRLRLVFGGRDLEVEQVAVSLSHEWPAGVSLRDVCLFQRFDARAEVDVVGVSGQHEGGHGFHASLFRFGYAVVVFAKMNDLDVKPRGVERGGDILFCGDADRASRMIEYGFGFHCGFSFVLLVSFGAAHDGSRAARVYFIRGWLGWKRAQSGG